MLLKLLRGLRGAGSRPVELTPKTTIGMAAHGNAATTRYALDTLFAATKGDFELVLVDDCSPDRTVDVFKAARARHRNTRIFAFDRNLEYCESVNAILSHAQGEQVVFVSNDIFVTPSYLRALLAAAAGTPGCGIVRGCSNFVDNGFPTHNLQVQPTRSTAELFALAEDVAARHVDCPLLEDRFLVGDAFLVTRSLIDCIGTFDTRFHGYVGDVDYGLRAQRAGFRLLLERRAFAWHQRDANIAFLPEAEQRAKLQRRHQRVGQALGEFLRKYSISMPEYSIHDMPFEELARIRNVDYAAPQDYARYLLPD